MEQLLVDMKEEALNGQGPFRKVVNRVRVVAPTLSIAEATMEQLTERVQSTIRALFENQTAAIRAEAVAEMRACREGTAAPVCSRVALNRAARRWSPVPPQGPFRSDAKPR